MNDELQQIKEKVSIVDLAEQFGAMPYGNGNILSCKQNPLRPGDKKINLKLYKSTNTYCDFAMGDKQSSVIDFYMNATNKTLKESIDDLKEMCDIQKVEVETINIPKTYNNIPKTYNKKYMSLEAVEKAFLSNPFWEDINTNKDYQMKHLLSVAPEWLFHEADSEDKLFFHNISKFSKKLNTSIYRLPDINGDFHTFKYRYLEILDEMKKWVSLRGSKADYLYCNIKDNKELLLVVEGTRDFITALLCGYSVVALPRASFEDIDFSIFVNKRVVFLDDNDNREFMKPLFNKSVCKKIYFDHNAFMSSDCKDFSDYLYKFNSLKDFKDKFDTYINTHNFEDAGNWKGALKDSKTLLTMQTLNEVPEVEALIPKFLYKGTATLIHSIPGQGKTSLILGILNKLIKEERTKDFIYFDADNPLSVLRDRLPRLAETFKDSMNYHTHTFSGVEDLREEMKRLCLFRGQGKDIVVVIDTLGNFVTSANKDEEVKEIMDIVRDLRDVFGATVFLIHHSNKTKNDEGDVVFRGSSIIAAVVDYVWGLQRKGETMTLKNNKGRFDYWDTIEVSINMRDYEININGMNDIDAYVEDENSNKEFTLERVIKCLKGQDWMKISDVQKQLNAHRSEADRRTVYKLIDDCIDIETNKVGRGWVAKYMKSEPEVIEYVSDDEMMEALEMVVI